MFAIETIASVIVGIVLMSYFMAARLFIICLGPFVAWISTWVLYAFGELVSSNRETADNTKRIIDHLQNNDSGSNESCSEPKGTVTDTSCTSVNASRVTNAEAKPLTSVSSKQPITRKWLCKSCGNMRSKTPCEHCGKFI